MLTPQRAIAGITTRDAPTS